MPFQEQTEKEKLSLGAFVFILYILSYFLHLPARINVLAAIRFDLLLALILIILICFDALGSEQRQEKDPISNSLFILIGYIILSLPLVEWPGSVIRVNFFLFLKAVLFYFSTIHTIKNTKQLKVLLFVFIGCQIFRVIEPLWLHFTTGYWGSATYDGAEFSARLAGSPYDIVNPNGLAFIILLTLPLLHFTSQGNGFLYKGFYVIVLPLLLYALVLTQSRSGLIGLFIIIFYIFMRSRKKTLFLTVLFIASIIIWINLDQTYKNRYLSINIFNTHVAGHDTAEGRIEGWVTGFRVFLDRPFFGHGLGTSLEAGANVVGHAAVAHNMYIEVLQELGLIGFIIVLLFLKNIVHSFYEVRLNLNKIRFKNSLLLKLSYSLEAISFLLLIFSFASYGLSIYTWYFFGGLSSVGLRLSKSHY